MWLVGHPGLIHVFAIAVKFGGVESWLFYPRSCKGSYPLRDHASLLVDLVVALQWCTCSSVLHSMLHRTCHPESTCIWPRVSSMKIVWLHRSMMSMSIGWGVTVIKCVVLAFAFPPRSVIFFGFFNEGALCSVVVQNFLVSLRRVSG